VSARIEGFRQAVKSLALDVAQLDLVGESGAGLERVDEQAQGVEREVSALVRAHVELAALEGAPPLRPRQAGTEAPEAEAAPAAAAARARMLG
jgi:hypothetical protein